MKLIKYTTKDCRCDCGGRAAINGTATYKLPLGFGFRGTAFVVDTAVYKGWAGVCMKCSKALLFYKSRRIATSRPKRINAKIAAAHALS